MAHNRRKGAAPLARIYGNDLTQEEIKVAIDYKDPDVIRRFLSPTGRIKGRRATGLTAKNQRRLGREIKRARFMALLPYTSEFSSGRR